MLTIPWELLGFRFFIKCKRSSSETNKLSLSLVSYFKFESNWLIVINPCFPNAPFLYSVKRREQKWDFGLKCTRKKVSVFGVILVRIFPHADWIRRDTLNLSIFSPNAGKYGSEQLWILTIFTQWWVNTVN